MMSSELQTSVEGAWVSRDTLDQWLNRLQYDEYKKAVCGVTVRFLTAEMSYRVGVVHSVAPPLQDGTLLVDAGTGPTEVVLPKNVSNSLFKKHELSDWMLTPLSKQDNIIKRLDEAAANVQSLRNLVKKNGKSPGAKPATPPSSARGGVPVSQVSVPMALPKKSTGRSVSAGATSPPADAPVLFPHALMIAADGTALGHLPVSEIVNRALASVGDEPWTVNGLSASASFSPFGMGLPSLGVFSIAAEGSTTAEIVKQLEQDTRGVCGVDMRVRDLMASCVKSWKKGIKSVGKDFPTRIMHLCADVQKLFQTESMVLNINSPTCVFGDLHGNFGDLHYFMEKLLVFGDINYTGTSFLFLGDYVDRGVHGLETVVYLFCLKVLAPRQVFMLRGNHESPEVNGDVKQYGDVSFKHEVMTKFPGRVGEQVWETINRVFRYLPAAGIIDDKIFCVHGGIPRFLGGDDDRLTTLGDSKFPRLQTIQVQPSVFQQESAWVQKCRKILEDLVWSDPADRGSALDDHGFGDNPRGIGLKTFGSRAVDNFLDRHGFTHIFRAHQEKSNGVRICDNARVLTIFSTSDYIGHQNGAGVVFVGHGSIRLVIKEASA
ncbi:Serine/threonine-protein phosphatase BSU1 [Diplonema papillatum]|nr:Serine/threonine-protein phosphatase BSU1 [Diplonema papillatum]